MAGLVPAIHVLLLSRRQKDVDARDNPRIKSGDGHDGGLERVLERGVRHAGLRVSVQKLRARSPGRGRWRNMICHPIVRNAEGARRASADGPAMPRHVAAVAARPCGERTQRQCSGRAVIFESGPMAPAADAARRRIQSCATRVQQKASPPAVLGCCRIDE